MRKAILLAMAAAIVAMFAVPGSASANWTKHHAALPAGQNAELEITGTDIRFTSSSGGVTCSSTISKVDFEGGTTTGKITSFAPEVSKQTTITEDCQGTGILEGCEVHQVTANNLPWTIHTATSDTVTITTGGVTNELSGFFCPTSAVATGGTVTMTVAAGETTTTSTATLSGTLPGDVGGLTPTLTVAGTVHVLGTITYGI